MQVDVLLRPGFSPGHLWETPEFENSLLKLNDVSVVRLIESLVHCEKEREFLYLDLWSLCGLKCFGESMPLSVVTLRYLQVMFHFIHFLCS